MQKEKRDSSPTTTTANTSTPTPALEDTDSDLDLDRMNVAELRDELKAKGVTGVSKLRKAELIEIECMMEEEEEDERGKTRDEEER